jgi:DNA-binding GntR family transcriptional regulator
MWRMARTTPTTRSGYVHDRLRADILRGALEPGSSLRLAALASSYDASMTVVREALGRLAEHNLAVLTPNQGFRVVDVSRSDLVAITDLRVLVEAEALRLSMANGDVYWEADVVSAHHVLERATFQLDGEPGSTQEWSDAHAAFHDALVVACANPRMLGLTRSLRDGAEIYRQLSGGSAHGNARDIAAEHRALKTATTTRDPRAPQLLVEHLQRTTDDLLGSDLLRG